MRDQRLAALPVTDATDRLVGVLTEGALLERLAPRRTPRWWEMLVDRRDELAAEYVKAIGRTVGDLMSAASVSIGPDAPVDAAASLMRRHAIDVVPVVADGLCLGLVARADVMDHVAWPAAPIPGTVTDVELERAMLEAMQQEPWIPQHRLTIEASGGVIRLTGLASSPVVRTALLAMARSVPGCIGVDDRLIVFHGGGLRRPTRGR
jgi:CBS domain-containing protein